MIIEQRIFDRHSGAIRRFTNIGKETGGRSRRKHIPGKLIADKLSAIGSLNQTVRLRGIASLDNRAWRRAALVADGIWRQILRRTLPLLRVQDSEITPLIGFSPKPTFGPAV